MKEIGSKFAKIGDTSLTELTKDITTYTQDLMHSRSRPAIDPINKDKISLLTLNDSKLYLYSQRAAGINLYRILNYIRPEKIFLQLKPDDINSCNPTQTVSPYQIIPSAILYSDALKILKNSGFLITEKKDKNVVNNPTMHYDRISSKTSLICAIWALQHKMSSIEVCDIPRVLFYRLLCNSVTLMQFQSMYSYISKVMGAQPDSIQIDEPDYPVTLAYKLYPHIWDSHSLNYVGKVLMESTSKSKKVLCIATRETGQRLEKLLLDGFTPDNYDNISLNQTSVVRKDCSEMVVEKLAIIDVICFGSNFINDIQRRSGFNRTCKFIQELVETERVESNYTMPAAKVLERTDLLQKLYLSMAKRYCTFGKDKYNEGKEELHTEFLKQILTDN